MEAAERHNLESFLLLNSSASKLKQKLLDLLTMIEFQRDAIDWPRYLNTLGLCASELVEIRKFLASERFASAQSIILTPKALITDTDTSLAKATEDRLAMFNHDAAPQYLRTKLDPRASAVEVLRASVDARTVSLRAMSGVMAERALTSHRDIVDKVLGDIRLLKQELDQDQEKLATVKLMTNQDDLLNIVATMTAGRDYAMRLKADGSK
ncbi:unnamed protein product [Mesocestoides corti]|uniref:Mediator of RNA polymerase II transcription subunit 8 n=1 Tax=Mesocestoides corti TaxID=53468 RepID=A0A0R3UPC0_MESCO|nr:unnamed protein product [Mesocestoides corti]